MESKTLKIHNVVLNRGNLAERFKGVGVEVGVERGVFAKMICTRNPGTELTGVDPWQAYKGYRDHVSQEKLDAFYKEALERLEGFNCQLLRAFSVPASRMFRNKSLDFVYIDANHDYAHVLEDIRAWAPKVKPGGMVAGHDYIRRKGQAHLYGVVDAVNEYCKEEGIEELTIYRGDDSPSWMFIK